MTVLDTTSVDKIGIVSFSFFVVSEAIAGITLDDFSSFFSASFSIFSSSNLGIVLTISDDNSPNESSSSFSISIFL